MHESRSRSRAVLSVVLVVLFSGGVALMHPVSAAAANSITHSALRNYSITFRDSGLAAGRGWSVRVLASNGSLAGQFTTANQSYVMHLPQGTYTYQVTAPTGWTFAGRSPAGFAVRGSHAVDVPFKIAHGFGALIFHERGLMPGQSWSVTVNWTGNSTTGTPPALNATESTTRTVLRFAVWPGALYSIQVATVPNYAGPSESTGGIWAPAHAVRIGVRFWGPTFTVAFTEVGLSNLSAQNWGVRFWGTTYYSNGSSIIEIPGVLRGMGYWYVVISPAGYTATPSSAYNLRINGPSTTVITFSAA